MATPTIAPAARVYQTNYYYAITYPIIDSTRILDTCKTYPGFEGFGIEPASADIKVGRKTYEAFAGTDSDFDGESTVGFIAIEGFSIEGDERDAPYGASCVVNPDDMIKAEKKYDGAITILEDLHKKLTKDLKTELAFGWISVSHTWLDDDSSSESAPPAKPAAKAPRAKATKPKAPRTRAATTVKK